MPSNSDTLAITSSYVGELALPYVAPAILSADTIANNFVTVKENVKKALVMKKLDGAVVQAAACDFTAQTAVTLTEQTLTPTELMVNMQFCKSEFRQDWEALATGRGAINSQIPPNFQTFLLQYAGAIVAKNVEQNIWQGNFDPLGAGGTPLVTNFNGLLYGIDAAITSGSLTNRTQTTGAWQGLSASTSGTFILNHLDSLLATAPVDITGDADTKIFMSKRSLFLLHTAMSSVTGVSNYSAEGRPTSFLGFEIVTPAGFPDNCALLSKTDNLYFGTDLVSDQNQAVVVDMTQTDGSDNVRVAMRFTGGTSFVDAGSCSLAYMSAAS